MRVTLLQLPLPLPLPLLFILLLSSCLTTVVVEATWSIVAADVDTQHVGVAIATCITAPSFYESFFDRTFINVPGKGAMVAQSVLQVDTRILDMAKSLLEQEIPPSAIINEIATEAVDGDTMFGGYQLFDIRQYGIVDLQGKQSAYTGARIAELYTEFKLPGSEQTSRGGIIFANNSSGSTSKNNYVYSVQGNIVEPGTIAASATAFGGGCDLADNLMIALEAGGQPELGDIRCTKFWSEVGASGRGSKASLVGYIKIIDKEGNVLIDIQAIAARESIVSDAVELLRVQYDEWRMTNQCKNNDSPTTTVPMSSSEEFAASYGGITFVLSAAIAATAALL